MITKSTTTPISVDRRAFIGLAVAMSGPLAGCNGVTKRTAPYRDEATDRPERNDNSDAITRVEGKIAQVYDRVEDIPLVADGEFVYDLQNSVESVDYEELVETAKDALKAADDLDQDVDARSKLGSICNGLQR